MKIPEVICTHVPKRKGKYLVLDEGVKGTVLARLCVSLEDWNAAMKKARIGAPLSPKQPKQEAQQ
jgi:hypothetical protein